MMKIVESFPKGGKRRNFSLQAISPFRSVLEHKERVKPPENVS